MPPKVAGRPSFLAGIIDDRSRFLAGARFVRRADAVRFAREINPHTIQVSLAAPYRGTELYRQAVENGWLANDGGRLVGRADPRQLEVAAGAAQAAGEMGEVLAVARQAAFDEHALGHPVAGDECKDFAAHI